MSRIPDEEIPRLKKEVPLVELCRKHGVDLKPQGSNFVGLCPFHEEKTPSFVITPSRNLWKCFGACGKGGSNIDFVMQMEKTDFRGAIEILRRHRGTLPATTFTTRQGTERVILVDPSSEPGDAGWIYVELPARCAASASSAERPASLSGLLSIADGLTAAVRRLFERGAG